MSYGPCEICGATDYGLSYGGPTICPSCDCGIPPDVAKLKQALSASLSRVAELERAVREERERCAKACEDRAAFMDAELEADERFALTEMADILRATAIETSGEVTQKA